MIRLLLILNILMILCLPLCGSESILPLKFDKYYTNQEIDAILSAFEKEFNGFAQKSIIGNSLQGKPLYCLTLTDKSQGESQKKPAILVDGNTHGNEIQGAEACLFAIQYLLENKEKRPYISKLLQDKTFYFIPVVNPDAREIFLSVPTSQHYPRTNLKPVDSDGDWKEGEDGYEDIDGDGEILNMRKKLDHMGDYQKQNQYDLVHRPFGETGEYVYLGLEGIDNDKDGRVNEDPPGGVDLNRNYPAYWQPEFKQWGAGDYPLSEPESRAVSEFILAHPNIAALQSFHNYGRMILRGPAYKEAGEVPSNDLKVFDGIGKQGEKFLPGYRYMNVLKDLYAGYGMALDWAYQELGIFSFTNELWNRGRDYNSNGKVEDSESRNWNRWEQYNEAFQEYREFQHPQYGLIEIGGWRKEFGRCPPVEELWEMCRKNCKFIIFHAGTMPQIEFQEMKIKKENGIYRVSFLVYNSGDMPTESAMAIKKKKNYPILINSTISQGKIIGMGRSEDIRDVSLNVSEFNDRMTISSLDGKSGQRIYILVKSDKTDEQQKCILNVYGFHRCSGKAQLEINITE